MSQSWRRWLNPSLKHIKAVIVRFDPTDPGVTGTRSVISRRHKLLLQLPPSTSISCITHQCSEFSFNRPVSSPLSFCRSVPLPPSVSEFFFQARSRKLARSNPKCAVSHEIFHDLSPPYIEFQYNNASVYKLLTADKTVDDITLEMALYTRHLQNSTGMGEEEELNEEEDEWALKNT
jgi:hypothetical protein